MDIDIAGFDEYNFKNTHAQYPMWQGSNKRQWDVFGGYNRKQYDRVEHFENNENSTNNYQEFLYSIIVYYYKHKNGLKKIQKTNYARLKNIKTEDIPELNYANSDEDGIKSNYTVTITDITSYLPNQPMLRMKCSVNNGEDMKDIQFINPEPLQFTMREYNLELSPFKEIKFLFDLNKMVTDNK